MYPTIALFLGVGHGVERAVGIIEGGKWFLGRRWCSGSPWDRTAAAAAGRAALDDFFFRYAIAFCSTLPIALAALPLQVRGLAQPSRMDPGAAVQVGFGAVLLTAIGTAAALTLAAACGGGAPRWTRCQQTQPAMAVRASRGQSVTTPSSSSTLAASIAGLAPGVEQQTPLVAALGQAGADQRPVSGDPTRAERAGIVEEWRRGRPASSCPGASETSRSDPSATAARTAWSCCAQKQHPALGALVPDLRQHGTGGTGILHVDRDAEVRSERGERLGEGRHRASAPQPEPPARAAATRSRRRGRSVVRTSDGSCISTGSPSAVSRTSTSTTSAPSSAALVMPAMLFSGASRGQVRWAMTSGRDGPRDVTRSWR